MNVTKRSFNLITFAKKGEDYAVLTVDEIKLEMTNLLYMCAVLPDSKVLGTDMFCKQTERTGLRGMFNQRIEELKNVFGNVHPNMFTDVMEDVMLDYNDRVREYLDREEGMYVNEEVDNAWNGLTKAPDLDAEFFAHRNSVAHVWTVADEMQRRHERMVMRLAIIDKLDAEDNKELKAQVNDALVERMLNKEAEFDKDLKPFVVSTKMLQKKEAEILRKNQASHFRMKLEDKAVLLRDFSYKAEQMEAGRIAMQPHFVAMVIKLANQTKVWCEGRFNRPKPYSKRAVNALYNEALHTLVALGKFRTAFTKKEFNPTTGKYDSGLECSFFGKRTAEDMVDVKSGANWADELRTCYYETEDGTAHTPVRNSGE